ncbi:uncharacterized protein LOC131174047 [Hevea brasiliensis]|uniref:uncharacterized protein LOC131174047 n=1 Tax=Hevea brasiliensis TaxID=3981 RepID=UPI002600A6A3|nr:uncharacterized protein LOC131174047 [Hevea brasiliensis]
MNINKILCDLGASVSLIPLLICQKLDVGELKPTTISLQLANRSVKYLIGILENIPIKVEKFFIPVDFVVLEMEKDVGDEEVEFNLFRAMKHELEPDECLRVDIIDKLVAEEFHKRRPEDPPEVYVVHDHTADNENTEIAVYAQSLEASPSLPLAQAFQVEELKEE